MHAHVSTEAAAWRDGSLYVRRCTASVDAPVPNLNTPGHQPHTLRRVVERRRRKRLPIIREPRAIRDQAMLQIAGQECSIEVAAILRHIRRVALIGKALAQKVCLRDVVKTPQADRRIEGPPLRVAAYQNPLPVGRRLFLRYRANRLPRPVAGPYVGPVATLGVSAMSPML